MPGYLPLRGQYTFSICWGQIMKSFSVPAQKNPGRTVSTLIEPYRFSTPFPFASTLIRKRSSIPARKPSSWLAHLHTRKKAVLRRTLFSTCGDGGNRTRVQEGILDKSTCLLCSIGLNIYPREHTTKINTES